MVLMQIFYFFSVNCAIYYFGCMIEQKQKARKTSIPVEILISESIFLHAWCQDDKTELVSAGVDWSFVESLPVVCEQCQTLYAKSCVEMNELAIHKKRLKKRFKAAIRVRSMIADKIRDTLKSAECTQKLSVYHRRRKYAEVIQDLHELAGLCSILQPQLDAVGFKASRAGAVTKCASLRLNDYLAVKQMGINARELRLEYLDSYRTLYNTVQQIRNKALAYFSKGSQRRDGYVSQYRKEFYTASSKDVKKQGSPPV